MADSSPSPIPAHAREATLSVAAANVVALVLLPISLLFFVLPYLLIWQRLALSAWGWVTLGLSLLPAIVAHEGLHALGLWLLGRVPRSAIEFGIQWQLLTPYTHCRVPVPAWVYRSATALPGLLLGLLPALLGLACGSPWLNLGGTFLTVAAAGDWTAIWAIRRVPPRARVLDHPSKVGALILDD